MTHVIMRRPRHRAITALVVIPALLALAACTSTAGSSSSPSANATTVTDGSGASVTIDGPITRVACLTGICDDALLELGLQPVASREAGSHDLLAQSEFLGPQAAAKIPTIGGSFGEENVEDVVKSTPDLVIGLAGVHDGLRSSIETAAPLYLVKTTKYQDSMDFLTWLGDITDHQQQAAAGVKKLQDKIDAAATRPSQLSSLLISGVDANFSVVTESALVGSILSTVGEYPWKDAKGGSFDEPGTASYSLEQILRTDPDVIFVQTIQVTPDPPTPISKLLAANPVWGRLKAVKNDHVIEVKALIWATGRGTRSLGIILDQAQQELADAK